MIWRRMPLGSMMNRPLHALARQPGADMRKTQGGEGCAGAVREEHEPKRDALALEKHAVVARDLLGGVGDDGDVHLAEAALAARRVDPRQVHKVRVGRRCDDLSGGRTSAKGEWMD